MTKVTLSSENMKLSYFQKILFYEPRPNVRRFFFAVILTVYRKFKVSLCRIVDKQNERLYDQKYRICIVYPENSIKKLQKRFGK